MDIQYSFYGIDSSGPDPMKFNVWRNFFPHLGKMTPQYVSRLGTGQKEVRDAWGQRRPPPFIKLTLAFWVLSAPGAERTPPGGRKAEVRRALSAVESSSLFN